MSLPTIANWADGELMKRWKLHAAARVFSICATGHDTGFRPGVRGRPSTLLNQLEGTGIDARRRVPGSPQRAATKYDVAQALSWVASQKTDFIQRSRHQARIPELLDLLQAA